MCVRQSLQQPYRMPFQSMCIISFTYCTTNVKRRKHVVCVFDVRELFHVKHILQQATRAYVNHATNFGICHGASSFTLVR